RAAGVARWHERSDPTTEVDDFVRVRQAGPHCLRPCQWRGPSPWRTGPLLVSRLAGTSEKMVSLRFPSFSGHFGILIRRRCGAIGRKVRRTSEDVINHRGSLSILEFREAGEQVEHQGCVVVILLGI